MKKSVNSVLIVLALIFIPFCVYAILQIRSLDENEKLAKDLYEKQMNIMLFSLNNLADDMMSQWMRRLSSEDKNLDENAYELTIGNESIQLLSIRNIEEKTNSLFSNDYVTIDEKTELAIEKWYKDKDSVLTKLTQYLNAGFQKINPVEDWQNIEGLRPTQTAFSAMIYDRDSTLQNALVVIETNYWIEQILGAQIEKMNLDGFNLAVIKDLKEPSLLYNSDDFNIEKGHVKNALWVLSDTYLALQPKGESYSDTIREASRNTLYFLLLSLFIFLVGSVVIVRNIRNALKIAQLKSDFVSNVSHEIRTPLSLIRMYAETLMLGRIKDDKKRDHYYNIIHHESGRLTYLVNNILDFSRIEANQKTYQFQPNDLNELANSLCTNFSFYFEEKKVDFSIELCTDNLTVSIDQMAIEEAISNLIENAIKYGGEKKRIRLRTFKENGLACVEITDHGMGISKEAQNHIFDKFYRVENALTQKTKGTGLGLALVKHILDAHNGEVVVVSEIGKGSSFTLKIPLKEQLND